jgi:hypothetical protein
VDRHVPAERYFELWKHEGDEIAAFDEFYEKLTLTVELGLAPE